MVTLSDNLVATLNQLRDEINSTYGLKRNIPAVNLGPCGRFARSFWSDWNSRFQYKIKIAFIMAQGSGECRHVVVRLPDGSYFDGGNGVMVSPPLIGIYIEEMKEFDINLLDRRSYGLGRYYSHCPNYSDAVTSEIISRHLAKLSEEDFESS